MHEIARLDDWRHPAVDVGDPGDTSERETQQETFDGLVGDDALRAILEYVGAPVPDRLARRPRPVTDAEREHSAS